MMITTRLMLKNNYDLFLPITDECTKMKTNRYDSFLLYFNLPNSRITIINDDDDMVISTSESEVESDSEKQTCSDTEENRSNAVLYETFFSRLLHKFSVFNDLPFEELPAELFLTTCEDFFTLVDKFNSPIFTPIKADVNGNITKLRRKINQNTMKFQTLYAIVNDEIDNHTTHARNSATDALMWLKRAFEFLAAFLHESGMGDKTLVNAVSKAYEQSLRRYHGMFARGVFSFALRAVPNNAQFVRSLAINSVDASETLFEHQVFNEILEHASNLSSVLQKITLFYSKHELESPQIIT